MWSHLNSCPPPGVISHSWHRAGGTLKLIGRACRGYECYDWWSPGEIEFLLVVMKRPEGEHGLDKVSIKLKHRRESRAHTTALPHLSPAHTVLATSPRVHSRATHSLLQRPTDVRMFSRCFRSSSRLWVCQTQISGKYHYIYQYLILPSYIYQWSFILI